MVSLFPILATLLLVLHCIQQQNKCTNVTCLKNKYVQMSIVTTSSVSTDRVEISEYIFDNRVYFLKWFMVLQLTE